MNKKEKIALLEARIKVLHLDIIDLSKMLGEANQKATQRGARMQIMHNMLKGQGAYYSNAGIDEFFDRDGVPL